MIKLAVSGCRGKMGSRIINLAAQNKTFEVTAALEAAGHADIGKEVAAVKISDDAGVIKAADVLIEFTTPQATLEHLKSCVGFSKPMVIGTTGLSEQEILEIKAASQKIPIVFSPNMSVGVNCLFELIRLAAKRLGLDYDIDIVEAHHAHKKDTPSGTAKKLAQIIKESGGQEVKDIKSIREGEIVADHRVIFQSAVDRIELFHSAKTRDIFVLGALRAAEFIAGKKPRLYSMEDVLGAAK